MWTLVDRSKVIDFDITFNLLHYYRSQKAKKATDYEGALNLYGYFLSGMTKSNDSEEGEFRIQSLVVHAEFVQRGRVLLRHDLL